MKQNNYETFKKAIEEATNEINQRSSAQTKRKGLAGLRDKFTFYKMAIFFAYGYISIIQTMIIFLGVTPSAIKNINDFLVVVGIPFQFPVDVASLLAIVIIFMLFVFGIFAMLLLGLYKREQEVATLQSPGWLMLMNQNQEILDLLKEKRK
jgi:hypothetical protein